MLMLSMAMLDMDTLMLMELMLTELFLSVPALVWTQSPKDLTQLPKELFHTMERDLLMLMPTLSMAMLDMDMDTHMLMELMLTELFLLDPAPAWTQSPKDLTQLLRELFLTMERDLLMLTLSMAMLLMELMLTELFLSVPALVWTQSPKDLTQLPKELLLTMERGLLMLMLSMLDTHMPMLDTHMPMLDIHMDMFHLVHPQELTQSPRVWTQSLKDLSTKQRVETRG